jgi:hypothetical protein
VGKLRPENDARRRQFSPNSARGFYAGKLWHLNVENGDRRLVLERKLHRLFAIGGFNDRRVRGKLFPQNLAQVVALGHVVFGN